MRLDVIIPARNATDHLRHLLTALLPQLGPGDTCVLVDDASTDRTAQVAADHGVNVLTMKTCGGPAAARNCGAQQASGDLLVFLDADVVPHPGLLDQMRQRFQHDPALSAAIGSYDTTPADPSIVSRYRNLLHCYTHHNGNPDASTFWAGCGAIRRPAFDSLGGFDAVKFAVPSIEDIELGFRLKRGGGKILLDPTLQVQHRKGWRLVGMVRTDVFQRAVPWTLLILNSRSMPVDLNLKSAQRVSAMATAMACVLLLLLPWFPVVAGGGVIALIVLVAVLNWDFYAFLAKCGGWGFAMLSFPLHLLYFLCSVVGYAIGSAQFHLKTNAAR